MKIIQCDKMFRLKPLGFTLIELLVVIAVLSLLISILLPCLQRTKIQSKSIVCCSNLSQITKAWIVYFLENDDSFYQGVNANHRFGGWKGQSGASVRRPLNPFVDMELVVETEDSSVFFCPSDSGGVLGRPENQRAYNHFGNSYQSNIIIIGPTQMPVPNNELKPLREAINLKLNNHIPLKTSHITSTPSQLLFIGDNNWWYQMEPYLPDGKPWHGKEKCFNMSFLDGHIDSIVMEKSMFVGNGYTIIPFKDLKSLAIEVQNLLISVNNVD